MKEFMNLKFSKEHIWARIDGNKAFIGITDYAQESLGVIVYIEFPEIGQKLKAHDTLGVLESVKAAFDIYVPIAGTVIQINEGLEDDPQSINYDPYKNWIAALEFKNTAELNNLMYLEEYNKFCNL